VTKFTDSNHNPFVSSYSTTEGTNRADQGGTNKDEWLTTVSSLSRIVNDYHEYSFDSYGCGINESFPCSSVKWTINHPLPGVEEEIRYKSRVIYVDKEEGNDEMKCGGVGLPCSSLSYSSSHFDSSSSKEMKILSLSLHNSFFSTNETTKIESNDEKKKKIEIEGNFNNEDSIQNEGSLTIEKINFFIKSSLSGISSLISSSSSLSLSFCSFSFEMFSLSLVSITFGCFNGISIEITKSSQITFPSSLSLFSFSSSSSSSSSSLNIFFSLCLFENLTLLSSSLLSFSSSLPSSSSSSFTIQNSNITNIEDEFSSSPSFFPFSSSLSLSLSLSLFVSNISLSSSSLLSSEGGGIRYSSCSEGEVKLERSTIHDCLCSEEEGRGGGIFLDFSSSYSSLSLSSLSFYRNVASFGEDMFIICSSSLPSLVSDYFEFALKNGKSLRYSLI
jgi:hypothetical protein